MNKPHETMVFQAEKDTFGILNTFIAM